LINFNQDHEKRWMLLCVHLLQLRFGMVIFITLPLSNIANIMETTAITEAVVNIMSNAMSEGKDRITPLIFRID
jgi:spore germination protein GerM